MKVGIYKQHLGGLHAGYLERYEKILTFNGIECIWLEANDPDFWNVVPRLDLFIYQWEHYDGIRPLAMSILPIVESEMKIPCFPNWKTSWHFDDKIKQYYLLKQHGFPTIDSYIFWEKDEALKWLETAQMPVVFKLKNGAGSSNVILVKSKSCAKRLICTMFGKGMKSGRIFDKNSLRFKHFNPHRELRGFAGDVLRKLLGECRPLFWRTHKNYVLFQKFMNNNSFDTRVSVIGERAFAFRRFNRENDFRASGSGKIDYDVNKIDLRTIEVAFNISHKLGFQSMAYDFLMTADNDFQLCEISYTYVDTAVYDCPGYWNPDLNWHEGHFWPQYCQLAGALKIPDLKQPEF